MLLNRVHRMRQAPQDRELWQKLYYKHQKSYQRKKLEAIKFLWEGLKIIDVRQKLGCSVNTLNGWIDDYLKGGFTELLKPRQSDNEGKGKISALRLRIFKYIILHKTPSDYANYGLTGYVWTLNSMQVLLSKKWQIDLKITRIREILDTKLNLSFQKHHRDYANASSVKQQNFVTDMQRRIDNQTEEEAHIWYDEFSVSTRPQASYGSYGWAEKNTSPSIPSNEKKENDIMDC